MSGPNPVDHPEQYDSFKLSGVQSPGICRFTQAPFRTVSWDMQNAMGTAGGQLVRVGSAPIDFDVEIYVWKGEHIMPDGTVSFVDDFAEWEDFMKILAKAPTITPGKAGATIGAEGSAAATSTAPGAGVSPSFDAAAVVKGLSIEHPMLSRLKPAITQVVLRGFSDALPDGKGGGTAKIAFREWRVQRILPIGVPGTDTGKTDPNKPYKDKVAALTAAFNSPGP